MLQALQALQTLQAFQTFQTFSVFSQFAGREGREGRCAGKRQTVKTDDPTSRAAFPVDRQESQLCVSFCSSSRMTERSIARKRNALNLFFPEWWPRCAGVGRVTRANSGDAGTRDDLQCLYEVVGHLTGREDSPTQRGSLE